MKRPVSDPVENHLSCLRVLSFYSASMLREKNSISKSMRDYSGRVREVVL